MQERPGEFELDGNRLRHQRSGHAFFFQNDTLSYIEAVCTCAQLRVDAADAEKLMRAFNTWSEEYWRPMQARREAEKRVTAINRQFALHFRPPSRAGRLVMRLADAWHAAVEAFTRPDPAPLRLIPSCLEEGQSVSNPQPSSSATSTIEA